MACSAVRGPDVAVATNRIIGGGIFGASQPTVTRSEGGRHGLRHRVPRPPPLYVWTWPRTPLANSQIR